MAWRPYDPFNPPKPGTRVKGTYCGETIAVEYSMVCQGKVNPSEWEVWHEDLPDTLRSPEFKPQTRECPCGIYRQDCTYHRD